MSMTYGVSEEKIKDIKMGLNLVSGKEYKETLTGISNVVAEVLVKTLGPYASTTTIDDGTYTYPTKDGWSVLNRLRFGSAIEDTMLKFIKQISFNLNSRVGDGTTTAVIAANHFIEQLQAYMTLLAKNNKIMRQADLLEMIESCSNEIIKELHSPKRLHRVTPDENGHYGDIYKIAYVSTNRNAEISKMITDIYDTTGNPNIHVTINGNGETFSEIQKGYKIDCKLLFPECYINTEDKTSKSNEDNLVYIFNNNVTYAEHYSMVNACIGIGNRDKKPVVIMAPYFDEIITGIFAGSIRKVFNQGKIPSVQFIQVPMTNSSQKNLIDDFAVLVGAQIIGYDKVRMFNQVTKQILKAEGKEINDEFDEYKDLIANSDIKYPEDILNMCVGVAHTLTTADKYLLIEDFDTETPAYKARKKLIDDAFDSAKSAMRDNLNKDYLEAHLRKVKFSGDTGMIHVGGDSDLVRQCMKDSVDDAVLACRSAFENGYIRGLNIETIDVSRELMYKYDMSQDADVRMRGSIFDIFFKTFLETSKDVMRNKYINNDFVYVIKDSDYKWGPDKNMTMDDVIHTCLDNNTCFDIVTEKFEDAGEGLVNSVSTDCEIISAMSSMLTLLLSSNQLLSINKMYDRKIGRQQIIDDKTEEIGAITATIADVLREKGVLTEGIKMIDGMNNITGTVSDVLLSTGTNISTMVDYTEAETTNDSIGSKITLGDRVSLINK